MSPDGAAGEAAQGDHAIQLAGVQFLRAVGDLKLGEEAAMTHENLLVVSTRGESIGKVIHNDGDETFLVEKETVFPRDFEFHYESSTGVSEDGSLVYTLTEYSEDEEREAAEAAADHAAADESTRR